MRKLLKIILFTFLAGGITSAYSQEKKDTTTVGQDLKHAGKSTGKAVKKAGKKVGEVGAKGAAEIKDKPLKNMKGPNGEKVYVDKYDRKYYISKDAKRIYIKD
jgi:hypothetical protein